MKIDIINNVPNIEATLNQLSDGSVTLTLKEKTQKILGQVNPGDVVKLGEREYIVLEHDTGATAVITKDYSTTMTFGDNNDYKTSKVREYCNTEFYNELVQAVGTKNVFKHKVELMADDGTNKNVVCFDNVSILTTELYRKYRQYIPEHDGWWWTATPTSSTINKYISRICCISFSGVINWDNCNCIHDVRPFCVLNSSILVS